MPYVQQSDLAADLPPDFLTQALDDDNDGVADIGLWDLIAQQVSDDIDAKIGPRYAVPLPSNPGQYPLTSGFPPVIVSAARTLALEKLFGRRGTTDNRNPWTGRANAVRQQLDRIGAGSLPLDPNEARENPSATAITGPLSTLPCPPGGIVPWCGGGLNV